jgi:hypothetical protein
MNQELPTNSGISKRTKKIILGFVITIICVPVLVVLIFCAAFFWYPDVTLHDADAGFRKAKKTINPEQLRAWALEEIPKYPQPTNDIFAPKIPNSEIPSYMQKLYSESVEDAIIQHDGQSCVQICWGGPFFHWMFYIGSTNFVLPNDSYVTSVEWVPGIYYSREDTAHPFK